MRTTLSILAACAVTSGCALLPHGENPTSRRPPRLVCGTGIAIRNIDNHTQHQVQPEWEVTA
jgi:hypothetical protein